MAKRRGQGRAAKKASRSKTRARPRKRAGGRASPKPAAKGRGKAGRKAGVRRRPAARAAALPEESAPADFAEHPVHSARLAGGDVDADLERAGSSGEEAVGGSEPTPDQDVVDMIGDAFGVGRAPDAQVIISSDMLAGRDRRRWRAERRAPTEDSR